MIVVDTSVWVDHLNDVATAQVTTLRDLVGMERVLVGDVILCEILQGLRSDREAESVERALRRFDIVPMLGIGVAVRAAAYFRLLRSKGITVRKTIDMIIGTFCILGSHILLHSDRDFDPMESHLGLRVIHT